MIERADIDLINHKLEQREEELSQCSKLKVYTEFFKKRGFAEPINKAQEQLDKEKTNGVNGGAFVHKGQLYKFKFDPRGQQVVLSRIIAHNILKEDGER